MTELEMLLAAPADDIPPPLRAQAIRELQNEVQRLRGVSCGITEEDKTMTPLCGVCLECAHLRGATEMREDAARMVEDSWLLTPQDAQRLAKEIRALFFPSPS